MKNALRVLICLLSITSFAQVGINTDTPAADAALDVEGTDKGILIPRVDIVDLSTIAPITGGSTESLMVYNTNLTTGKGFYYWSGTEWIPVGKGLYWEKNGNSGTVPGTSAGENYLGTQDSQDLVIATNSNEALRVTRNGQILAADKGSSESPVYSFKDDSDTGIYSGDDNVLNLTAGGINLVELDGGTDPQIVVNKDNGDIDTRIASQGESHMLYVDATANRVGIAQPSPESTLHIGGTGSTMRIDALNSSNNSNNKGIVSTPVFVDANGELGIEGSNIITQLALDDAAFLNTAVQVDNTSSLRTLSLLYNTTVTLTQDALIEVVYQAGVTITDTSNNVIRDGRPRVYRIYVLIDGKKVAYKGDAYTSRSAAGTTVVNGPFFLNGNGYVQLPGVVGGTTHNIAVYAEVYGNTASTRCNFGGTGDDLFQVLVRY